jgi:hypothetical protein
MRPVVDFSGFRVGVGWSLAVKIFDHIDELVEEIFVIPGSR